MQTLLSGKINGEQKQIVNDSRRASRGKFASFQNAHNASNLTPCALPNAARAAESTSPLTLLGPGGDAAVAEKERQARKQITQLETGEIRKTATQS